MERKRLTYLLLAIFILVIFLSSYVSLTNLNTTNTSTSTVVPATVYAQGITHAKILGYGIPFYINVRCSNSIASNATANTISTNLDNLEVNGSVLTFQNIGGNISIDPQNMSVYKIYSLLNSNLTKNQTGCITPYADSFIGLPQYINMSVGGQKGTVTVPQSYLNSSIFTQIKNPPGANVTVKIYALVTQNGTVYGQPTISLV